VFDQPVIVNVTPPGTTNFTELMTEFPPVLSEESLQMIFEFESTLREKSLAAKLGAANAANATPKNKQSHLRMPLIETSR
jgi:hypothetical protein